MIARYTRAEMGHVWSEETKFKKWLEVELAATETLAEAGIVPREAAARMRDRARVDVARIQEHEARVRHDVIAFTIAVGESINDADTARWLHYGLTSNDVVDTALALVLRDASRLIENGIERYLEVLERRAWEFKDTPEIGRTHGVHAEPITFGLKVAGWHAEIRRNLQRFPEQVLRVLKSFFIYSRFSLDLEPPRVFGERRLRGRRTIAAYNVLEGRIMVGRRRVGCSSVQNGQCLRDAIDRLRIVAVEHQIRRPFLFAVKFNKPSCQAMMDLNGFNTHLGQSNSPVRAGLAP